MDQRPRGLDHLIIAVRNLDEATTACGRLGFACSVEGRHAGWSTANRCLMFSHDYLEILAATDFDNAPPGLGPFLNCREGLYGMALATNNAAATVAAWQGYGFVSATDQLLGRRLPAGDGVEAADLRFHNALLDVAETEELMVFACHHLTPAAMRRPTWLSHPNTAQRILAATWAVDDARRFADLFGRAVGTANLAWTDRVLTVHLGGASVMFCPKDDIGMLHPEWNAFELEAGPPIGLSLSLEVADPQACHAQLAQSGIASTARPDGSLSVSAASAMGVALEFRAAA